ncbi:MAG: hypothetical protein ABIA78_01310 [archaeon]
MEIEYKSNLGTEYQTSESYSLSPALMSIDFTEESDMGYNIKMGCKSSCRATCRGGCRGCLGCRRCRANEGEEGIESSKLASMVDEVLQLE